MFLFPFIARYQKCVCFPNLNISLTGLSLYLYVNMSTCICAVLIVLSKFHFVMCDKHIQKKIYIIDLFDITLAFIILQILGFDYTHV